MIDIIFITNNGGCLPNHHNFGLYELMSALLPPRITAKLICSRPSPYLSDKGKAFKGEMPGRTIRICPILRRSNAMRVRSGGSRRSKKQSKRLHKSTRKMKLKKRKSISRKIHK
jgi:hypothetical protein